MLHTGLNMKNLRLFIVFALAGLFCMPLLQTSVEGAQGQDPLPTPGVIRINVNLVQVDAVVTDSKGRPVTDLKAEDFEVLQDGKVQKIRNFEFVRVKDTLGSMVVRSGDVLPARIPLATPPPPPANLRPDDVRRTIALVVDDIALSFDGTVHVREALKKWVDHEMQPGDLVSIVRTNAATGALQQFTNDKRLLHTAINHLKFQPGRVGVGGFNAFTPAPPTQTNPETGEVVPILGPDTALFDMELQSAYLVGSYNAIKYVIQGLRELPGRKSLILFSEDLSIPSYDSSAQQQRPIEDRLRILADEANRSSVVIYAIDPRGSVYLGPTASDNLSGRTDQEIVSMINGRANQYTASQDGMVLLAQRTGGLFYSGMNDLATPLRKAVDDGDGYYLMGYTPDESTFELKMDTLKYHTIKVRLKRPGLTVRSRTGFYGMPDARPEPAETQTSQTQIAKALVSPFTTADLRVKLTTLFTYSETEGPTLRTLLYFDANDLTFTEEADGARSASVDIAVVTFDENGEPAQAVHKRMALRVPKENYEAVLRQGLVHGVVVPIKKAGPYQLRVALRDTSSKKLGSAMQFVDVPDVKSGRLVLSGIVVSRDPPLPNDAASTPAVRIFKSGDSISYAYEIMNARSGSDDKSQLETMTRLYRDGEIVFEGKPSPVTLSDKDTKRFVMAGRMQLTRIAPGDYVMQIIAFDSLRKDKNKVATQTMDFTVR
jgi:VWFA-related protein